MGHSKRKKTAGTEWWVILVCCLTLRSSCCYAHTVIQGMNEQARGEESFMKAKAIKSIFTAKT